MLGVQGVSKRELLRVLLLAYKENCKCMGCAGGCSGRLNALVLARFLEEAKLRGIGSPERESPSAAYDQSRSR